MAVLQIRQKKQTEQKFQISDIYHYQILQPLDTQ